MFGKISKTRHHFQGLEKGRNNKLSNKEKRALKHPINRARWQMVQADGIYTPWRRRQRAGGHVVCPRCGCGQGDLEHMIWECPETLKSATEGHRYLARIRQNMQNEAGCLWALGHIPADWEYGETELAHQQPTVVDSGNYIPANPVEKIGTGGGGKNNEQVGYGIAWKEPLEDCGEAVLGPRQTSQRAEVNAVAEAAVRARSRLHIVTDSQYVKDTIHNIRGDPKPYWGKHGDLWTFVTDHKHRIYEVTWLKSHMTKKAGRKKGFPMEKWELNDRADRQATQGAKAHNSRNTPPQKMKGIN